MQIQVIMAATFTRPSDTTAYASGDLVANSTTAASVTPVSFADTLRFTSAFGQIRRARILKSGTGVTNAAFRLHLYKTLPTVTNGDNGAWVSTSAGYLGSLDITVDKAHSDGASGQGAPASGNGSEINYKIDGSNVTIYGLLEARGIYTPGNAETFTITLEIVS